MREHTEERLEKEWKELYEHMKRVLAQYGKDDIDGGDYFLVDENFDRYTHQVEIHELHMLRPEIIKALQSLLVDYPDWEIEISVYTPDRKVSIDPGALTIRDTEIIDTLARKALPAEYQAIKYEGSRPPRDFFPPGDKRD